VVLLSLKLLPDANQNEIWPTLLDIGSYGYPLRKISTLTQNEVVGDPFSSSRTIREERVAI
jgi:hypothetical protein